MTPKWKTKSHKASCGWENATLPTYKSASACRSTRIIESSSRGFPSMTSNGVRRQEKTEKTAKVLMEEGKTGISLNVKKNNLN